MTYRTYSTLSAAVIALLPLLAGCGAKGLPEPPAPDPPATGATATIRPADVPSGPMTLRELLQGKTSGLEFITQADGSQRIQIRGMSSINPTQNPEPLVLIDDIQVPMNQLGSALSGLTRDDIRKVDVLKDVASTSSYGMRGAGGVILIYTTRR